MTSDIPPGGIPNVCRLTRQKVRPVVLVAAVVMLRAVPAASQTTLDQSALDARILPQALDRVSQRVDDSQSPQEGDRGSSLLRDIGSDYRRFFTTRDTLRTLGVGLAASLSVRPLDDDIVSSGFNSALPEHDSQGLDKVFEPGRILGGGFVQVGAAFATYGVGSLLDATEVSGLGRDLVRVQLLTQGVTQFLKHTVRRMRPDGSSRTSFPSGHASGTFASAAVLQSHYGWRVGIPAFGVASYVAASRLAHNRHYLSDVVFGAAVGLTAGRTVTFVRGETQFTLSPMVAPGGAGVQVLILRLQ